MTKISPMDLLACYYRREHDWLGHEKQILNFDPYDLNQQVKVELRKHGCEILKQVMVGMNKELNNKSEKETLEVIKDIENSY